MSFSLARGMRAVAAIALYLVSAIVSPVVAAHAERPSHACHIGVLSIDAMTVDKANASAPRGASVADHDTVSRKGDDGRLRYGDADCRAACSMALATASAEAVIAPRDVAAAPFPPHVDKAASLSPRRLSRPPKSPFV